MQPEPCAMVHVVGIKGAGADCHKVLCKTVLCSILSPDKASKMYGTADMIGIHNAIVLVGWAQQSVHPLLVSAYYPLWFRSSINHH